MKLIQTLDGATSQPPINSENILIKIDFTRRGVNSKGVVSLLNVDFTQENAKAINADRASAKEPNGRSLYEGMPNKYELVQGSKRLLLWDGYIDKKSGSTTYSCNRVRAQLKETGSKTWMEEGNEDGFDFEYLFFTGAITRDDFIYIPYALLKITQEDAEVAQILFMFAFTLIELVKAISDFGAMLARLAGVFTTVPALIELGLQLLYIAILFLTLARMFVQQVNLLVQPVKFHAVMKIKTLFEKGAKELGLDFESTKFDDDFWENTVILPEKSTGVYDTSLGSIVLDNLLAGATSPNNILQRGFFNGTFGDYNEAMRKLWNGKKILNNGVYRIERRDFQSGDPLFTLEDIELLDDSDNAGEIKAHTTIRFATDPIERNTVINLGGTIANIKVGVKSVGNRLNLSIPGRERVNIPLARATTKTGFDKKEVFFKRIFKSITPIMNSLIKINKKKLQNINVPDFESLIESRFGILLLEDDSTSVAKIFSIIEGTTPRTTKIHPDNDLRISADGVYNESYKIDSHVTTTSNPNANQYTYFKIPPFTLCFDEIKLLVDGIRESQNNRIFINKGTIEAEILTAEIVPETGRVNEMTIQINEALDNQLEEKLTLSTNL